MRVCVCVVFMCFFWRGDVDGCPWIVGKEGEEEDDGGRGGDQKRNLLSDPLMTLGVRAPADGAVSAVYPVNQPTNHPTD